MPLTTRTVLLAFFSLTVFFSLIAYVIYEYRSPTGFYARQHADIRTSEPENSQPYTDTTGSPIALTDFVGKPLIVNIWASWSPYTETEHRTLGEIASQFGDALTIIVMNRGEDIVRGEAYLDMTGRNSSFRYLYDSSDRYYRSVGGYAMPETIVYDRIGDIVLHVRGVFDQDELTNMLTTLVGDGE
jgi:thiol-disulfide isomerase/thioredoxin